MTGPLITPVTSSPTWQLLRLRFSPRPDRALVCLATHGEDCLVPPRSGDLWGYPRPTVSEMRRGEFHDIVWISMTSRTCWVDTFGRAAASECVPTRYEVGWRVSDPVMAAQHAVTEEMANRLIAQHIEENASPPKAPDPLRTPPPRRGTIEIEPPGRPKVIADTGLTYWFIDPPAALLPAPRTGAELTLPPGFGEAHREAYRFYREVVAGGPVGLAAFWLLQRPEQAKDVLDWTVAHRDLLTDRDSWERTLASTLQGLTEADRGFVGANLARVLSEVGVAQGDEVLRRIGYDGHRGEANGGYGKPL